MSGPVQPSSGPQADMGVSTIEVREGRTTNIGRLGIMRVLPTKGRRTIGPWCFVDLMSPDDVENPPPMEVGPHPHTGLATVTWLFAGSAVHSDSLGTEQLIRPGELNLMTAGHGIAHAELGVETAAASATGGVMGAQMWIAQTETTRDGRSDFKHLSELPNVDLGSGEAHVLIGEFGGHSSGAIVDHPAVGLDLTLTTGTEIATNPGFEYGIVPVDRAVRVTESIVEPGSLALISPGQDSLHIEARGGPGRVLMLGGEPLGEQIKMWWNFVARTQEELTKSWSDWQNHNEDRFGPVPSALERMDAPVPPWVKQ